MKKKQQQENSNRKSYVAQKEISFVTCVEQRLCTTLYEWKPHTYL